MKTVQVFLFAGVSFAISSPLQAGDLERFMRIFSTQCTSPPFEATERWPSIPAGGIPWTLRTDVNNVIIPGLPGCSTAATSPGFQSILRGMSAWNSVQIPATPCGTGGSVMSTFVFDTTLIPVDTSTNVNDLDGTNLVTAHQTANWWAMPGGGGGSLVLAVARVTVQRGPPLSPGVLGDVFDADIALNAESISGSNRNYGWVEVNNSVPGLAGLTFVNEFNPLQAFADIEGVIAHEAGHAAGLGHSVTDSEASSTGSAFPTMFPTAQVEPFQARAVGFNGGVCPSGVALQVLVSGSGTVLGGILGRSARTLELDDRAAIARGYPNATFGTALGTIQGTVRLAGQAVPGHAVAVIGQGCPQSARVSTFAYTTLNGSYSISGLPPGTYFVCVESVDHPATAGSGSFYFPNGVVPNFIWPLLTAPNSACPPPSWVDFSGVAVPRIFREFFNANDAAGEAMQRADTVTVAAGQVVTNIDFAVARNPQDQGLLQNARLEVGLVGGPFSMRGTESASSGSMLEIRVSDPAHALSSLTLHFCHQLGNSLNGAGQLLEVVPVLGGGMPGTLTGTLNISGSFSHFLSPASVQPLRNLWVQAQLFPLGGGTPILTNPINIWVNRP